jgi:cyclopropane fatty-acyl-phospholipid synthase-like methyltransferase
MLMDKQDAFGHEMYDCFIDEKKRSYIVEIVERDDGYIEATGGPVRYLSEYKIWPSYYKKAMRYARGRVLDIGCGAGRHAVYLQGKGLDVVGIDNSPLAIEVCKQRGLKDARVLSINQINSKLGIFDTILMMGGNFGLFGSFNGAKRLLKKLAKITSRKGRIIAESMDIYQTDNPDHLSYQEFNRRRGRMSGQVRFRVRYKKYATPWFDYLMVSKEEMANILKGTGWEISKLIDSPWPSYVAIIDKKRK